MVTVSVIMGIYNCAATLPQAIDSILAQTFCDWELIMCDDGSTDSTFAVAREYAARFPEKITVLQNEHNLGLNATLNRCLEVAQGQFIARMDGDDICSANRFSEELAVLNNEPDIAIVSTDISVFDDHGFWGQIRYPEYPQSRDFLRCSPFCHGPCMVREEAYRTVGGYSVEKRLLRMEDYHLWLKMYRAGFRGKNIHLPLYSMRDDRNAYRRRKFRYRLNEAYVRLLVVRELGLPITGYIFVLRPILVGLLPAALYDRLHRWNLRSRHEDTK